jgi:hypothetical protein
VRQHHSAAEELRLELAPRSGRGARPSATVEHGAAAGA